MLWIKGMHFFLSCGLEYMYIFIMNIGTDSLFQKIFTVVSPISHAHFPSWLWHFSHSEVGSRFPPFKSGKGCNSRKSDAILTPHLSPKRQYSFHLVFEGRLLLEPGHHALRKPKHSTQRNQGPQHQLSSQMKASASLPEMWVSHFENGFSSPCCSYAIWHHVGQRELSLLSPAQIDYLWPE